MTRVALEWQVELRHSGYHLNGRGATPEAAMHDLIERTERQRQSSQEEAQGFERKVEHLTHYLSRLPAVESATFEEGESGT